MSDALTIARWAFAPQKCRTVNGVVSVYRSDTDEWVDFDPEGDWTDAHNAESILIERGHAEAYGNAIGRDMLADMAVTRRADRELDISWEVSGEEIAALVSAPLDARVRAMAAVIRALPT